MAEAKQLPGRYHEPTIERFEAARTHAGYTQTRGAYEAFLLALLERYSLVPDAQPTVPDVQPLSVEAFYEVLDLSADEQAALNKILASLGCDMGYFFRRLLRKEIDAEQRRQQRRADACG